MRGIAVLAVLLVATPVHGDDLDAPDPTEIEGKPERDKTYELDLDWFSLRLGGGVLVDYNTFGQDDDSEAQLDLHPESGVRDLRGLLNGKLYGTFAANPLQFAADTHRR